jgi:hypothetical protein
MAYLHLQDMDNVETNDNGHLILFGDGLMFTCICFKNLQSMVEKVLAKFWSGTRVNRTRNIQGATPVNWFIQS